MKTSAERMPLRSRLGWRVVQRVQERRPDALLFAGSIRPGNAASHAEKLRTWEGFFEGVGKLDIFAALVPGAADVPLRDFLRLALHAEVKYPKLHAVHATLLDKTTLPFAAWVVS